MARCMTGLLRRVTCAAGATGHRERSLLASRRAGDGTLPGGCREAHRGAVSAVCHLHPADIRRRSGSDGKVPQRARCADRRCCVPWPCVHFHTRIDALRGGPLRCISHDCPGADRRARAASLALCRRLQVWRGGRRSSRLCQLRAPHRSLIGNIIAPGCGWGLPRDTLGL
jgi:hypothetical protein